MKKQRQSIIVVASLIDNTPNIAGLVRTCEIFNVEAVSLINIALITFLFIINRLLLVTRK